ncbi:single-stranded DNA-binding protein [Falsiruegeria litorea]|uniref:single-stranded DNA-binding protein n=1 Tax=Falsiruegeria litorea TaxID=1280831 RepID=UPI00333FE2BE
MALNRAEVIGHLGGDPEIRTFPSGGKVANFSVATTDKWRDRNTGEQRERTEWHRISIVADGLAKVVEQYLRKGSKVYIAGQLRTRKWQTQSGEDRYSTEIVVAGNNGTLEMLGDARSGGGDNRGGYQDGSQSRGQSGGQSGGGSGPQTGGIDDDEIPF